MRKKLTLPIIILMLLSACVGLQPKDPFAYASYGTLATSLASYKVILGVFTDLRAQGQVSDDKWVQFSKLANKFLDAHIQADQTMSAYKAGTTPQAQADVIMKVLNAALQELTAYYKAQVPQDKIKPLIS